MDNPPDERAQIGCGGAAKAPGGSDRHVTPAAPTTRVSSPSRYPDALRGQPSEPRTRRYGNATGGTIVRQDWGRGRLAWAPIARTCVPTHPAGRPFARATAAVQLCRQATASNRTESKTRRGRAHVPAGRPTGVAAGPSEIPPLALIPDGQPSATCTCTMSTTHRRYETPEEYNARLAEECPVSVPVWKAVKGITYSVLALAVVYTAVVYGAPPKLMAGLGILSLVVFFVGEVAEVQIASLVITFSRNGKHEKEDDP